MQKIKPITFKVVCKRCEKVLTDTLDENSWFYDRDSKDFIEVINGNWACEGCNQSDFKFLLKPIKDIKEIT